MSGRLADIKDVHWSGCTEEDYDWLIAEVEWLQAAQDQYMADLDEAEAHAVRCQRAEAVGDEAVARMLRKRNETC